MPPRGYASSASAGPATCVPNMLQMVVVEFFRTFWTAAFSLLGFTLHWTHAPR